MRTIKDFIIDERQVNYARLNGANAVLLIVRILDDEQLVKLATAIEALGMLPIIEVFDMSDLQRALAVNPKVLMINNRNLDTLAMNIQNTT